MSLAGGPAANTLQIKLKCNRIFELSLNTKAIVKFKKEYIKIFIDITFISGIAGSHSKIDTVDDCIFRL